MLYLSYALLSSCIVISACGAAIEPSRTTISINNLDKKTLTTLGQEKERYKRSSSNFFSLVKEKVSNGIKSKISKIASSSKHVSSGSSGGHSSHHPHPEIYYDHDPNVYDHYDHPPEYHSEEPFEVKSFDFWDLQKSILHTLLQAAKAIKGGLIAVKGHLIKGSGYIISAKGKLLSAKGEAITNIGKHIATTAVLSPYQHHHIDHHPVEVDYSPPPVIHHHGPHYPIPPPPPSHHHDYSSNFDELTKSLPKGLKGILVLQKIPKEKPEVLSGSHEDTSLSDYFGAGLPKEHKADLKTIIQNYLLSSHTKNSHSSSHIPEADKSPDHDISPESHFDLPSYDEFKPELIKNFEPTPNSVDYDSFKYDSSDEHLKYNSSALHSDYPPNSNLQSQEYVTKLKPPSTNYGVPFDPESQEHHAEKYQMSPIESNPVLPTNYNYPPLGPLETYEPLKFPEKMTQYVDQYKNFARYPSESPTYEGHQGVNQNLHSQANNLLSHFNKYGSLPELEVSSSEHKQSVYSKGLEQRLKNKHTNKRNVLSNMTRRFRYPPNVTKQKLFPPNIVHSRPKWTRDHLTKL